MEEIKLIISGQPIPKKNNMRILPAADRRPFIAPSKNFMEYQRNAAQYIPEEARVLIDQPCNIACQYFRGTRHRVDLVNLLQGTDDILVHYNVLADDNCKIVAAHDTSRVRYDKEHPRVEITITPLADSQ